MVNNNEGAYEPKFNKALEYGDTAKQVYLLVGISYFQRNKLAQAKTTFEKGLTKFPDEFDFLNLLGNIEQQMGNSAAALNYYEKAKEQNPDDVNNLVALAGLYENFKRYKESNDTYDKVLSIDPDNALALNNYAYYLSERGERLEDALKMSKRSLENNQENGSYLDTYGWILYKMKKYEEARDYIIKSLKANPNSAVVNDHLGDVYDALNDRTNAFKYWKKASELDPNNPEFKNKISK
jgi:tetratricopeptide (TPR) repeat protein